MFHRKFLGVLLILLLLLPVVFLGATEPTTTVNDLTKAYEVWKNHGIRFVIRGENGAFETWGIGRLESWDAKSRWVVRNPKGRFLTNATGNVEHWKNGQTRLVLRTPKGQLMTHISIDLTDRASFAKNVVGLRRLEADSKFIHFVQETLAELLVDELKKGDTLRTKVLLDYIRINKSKGGMKNFVPVLRAALQQLNFMAGQNTDSVIKSLAEAAREQLKELK